VVLTIAAACATAAISAPVNARATQASDPGGNASELKEEYDEVMGREVQMLEDLARAQGEREQAAAKLADLVAQTQAKQVELVLAQQALTEAEALVARREAAQERAEAQVGAARDRLRKQIVASYVTGGESINTWEAFLQAQNGDDVGQALAFGRAVSDSTEVLVDELEEAEAARRKAANAAQRARRASQSTRDSAQEAAEFLLGAQARQQELVDDLNVRFVVEAAALREVQGRKALVEGRINAMNRVSDGVSMILAGLQADQPDWKPGDVEVTTPMPGVMPGSEFGQRLHPILGITRLHAGVDMGGDTGDPVHAVGDGVVVIAEVRGGFGNTVVIDHGHSLGTLYAHNSRLLVKAGDKVRRGQVISELGSTGLSTGPHLHFETRIKGMPIDPEGVIDFARKVDYSDLDDPDDLDD
jgi:murein DD-endopeptidase MepM/ murein hydrolase activator NlpD